MSLHEYALSDTDVEIIAREGEIFATIVEIVAIAGRNLTKFIGPRKILAQSAAIATGFLVEDHAMKDIC